MVHPENEPEPGTAEVPADSEPRQDTARPPDILDWEACLDSPPPRPSGTIKVHLRYRGRDKPIPVDEPED